MALFGLLKRSAAEPSIYEQVARLEQQLRAVQIQIQGAHDSAKYVREASQRLQELDRRLAGVMAQMQDDAARVSSLASQVQGLKGGRPRNGQQAAAEVGNRVIEAMQNPALLQQLITELQGHAQTAAPPSPISMLPRYDPRA